jgi:two-component system chemotaxis response regulator CheY
VAEVLVVDDSPTMRQAVVAALEGAGYACDQAENGAEGLHRALLTPYRLVITDLEMPVMGGLNFIAALRSREKTRYLPVLVLTSAHEVEIVERARDLEVRGYLLKPVAPEDLLQRAAPFLPRR